MHPYEFPDKIMLFFSSVYATIQDLNLVYMALYILMYIYIVVVLTTFLVVYFDKKVIESFFSDDYTIYAKPMLFYLATLVFIHILNYNAGVLTIFVEMFFIVEIIKLIGSINNTAGKNILQIIGGFALVELILSPNGDWGNIESMLVISLLITSFILLFIMESKLKTTIIDKHNKITEYIVAKLVQTNPQDPQT